MRVVRLIAAVPLIAFASTAQATTFVIMVEPMTFERHLRIFDTPGPDRVLMCMAPPSTSGCTELPFKKSR